MSISVDEAVQRATELSDLGFNCAESVLQAMQEVYGFEGEKVWAAAAAFGGGIGRTQLVCGAVAGGAIALGLAIAQGIEDPKAEPKMVADLVRPAARSLVEGFQEKFGAVNCGDLLPYDFRAPGEYDRFKDSGLKDHTCRLFIRYVVEELAREREEALKG